MLTAEDQKKIIQNACFAFMGQTGIRVEITGRPNLRRLTVRLPGGKVHLFPEVKGRITPTDAVLPLMKGKQPEGFILVTRQVTETIADKLQKNGIQFMDEAGNAYINHPPVYIYIKGNKHPAPTKALVIGRAFKQTGLRVLYTLLCNPGLENQPYRTIAEKAGVALGMVNWVMRELKELGFLLEKGEGRGREILLINKERLLERWITAYPEQLRPRLVLGRFRGVAGWWKDAELDPAQAQWGGEPAAAKLAGYLNPQEITVYVDKENPGAVLIPHKLKTDPDGEVELLCRFWRPDAIPLNRDMVHPLLIYADLMGTGNQRNIETARMIYEQHIVQFVREA
jgi:hypothetical protein